MCECIVVSRASTNHMQSARYSDTSAFKMVNKYKRKTTNASWDEDIMKRAMEEAGKTSVKGAAKKYGINLSTLQRHIKKGCPKRKLGRFITVFNENQEKELLEYVFHMDSLFFGLTKIDFLKLVYQYAEINHIPHPFKNNTAGEDWFAGFKMRHPDMSLRRPEPTSIARARGFNKPQVQRFFDILEQEIEKHNIDATRIYNVDETGVQTTSNRPPRILCRSGKKQVGVISSVERGKLTTIVCCCNAAGSFIPPFLIFGRKRMVPRLLDGAPPGSVASCTDNGWINGPTFLEWLRHFVDMTRPTEQRKILLVMDNHESHKHLQALEFASKNHVIFVSFPPHTTHRLQPLDTCVYGPLKIYFEQAISLFQRTHVGRIVSQYEVARLFNEAYMKAASAHNAIKGFSSTGVWPTNRHIFDDSDYLPSTLTDRPEPIENEDVAAPNDPELPAVETENSIEIPFTSNYNIRLSIDSDRTISPSVLDEILNRNSVCKIPTLMAGFELMTPHADNTLAPETIKVSINNTNEQDSQPEIVAPHVTPIEIRPSPKMMVHTTNTRRRKTQRAEILTSTPIKDQQREKEEKKKVSTNKIQAVKKNLRVVKASTSKTKKQKRSKRGPKDNEDHGAEYPCLVCSELYSYPPIEDWIKCDDCQMWAHEACTTYSGRGSYYCDSCQE
ncbi:hypothetical protein PYW08_011090 [Mythimna loreyi]|uniref:Uncharacterized protein n=1 Tax=Mythimna loreyi TaxID=667449 RepID=A0ACC2Q2J4_9NEOP|nr:hypothetical protein PYW08_011090 [Mythimna loreyi]